MLIPVLLPESDLQPSSHAHLDVRVVLYKETNLAGQSNKERKYRNYYLAPLF